MHVLNPVINKTRFWVNKISLTPLLIIEVYVPTPKSKRSCICVLVILILPPFTIFLFYFGIVPTALYFLFFILLIRNTFLCSCRDFDIKTVFVFYSYLFKEYTLHTVAMKTKWLSVPESLFIELNQYTVTGSFISNHLFSKYSPVISNSIFLLFFSFKEELL